MESPDLPGRFTDLVADLVGGRVSTAEAAARLRPRGGAFSRLADWLETHPVSTTAAGVLITAIATLVGPQLAQPSEHGPSPKDVSRMVDTILDHYDRTQHQATDEHPRKQSTDRG